MIHLCFTDTSKHTEAFIWPRLPGPHPVSNVLFSILCPPGVLLCGTARNRVGESTGDLKIHQKYGGEGDLRVGWAQRHP